MLATLLLYKPARDFAVSKHRNAIARAMPSDLDVWKQTVVQSRSLADELAVPCLLRRRRGVHSPEHQLCHVTLS